MNKIEGSSSAAKETTANSLSKAINMFAWDLPNGGNRMLFGRNR